MKSRIFILWNVVEYEQKMDIKLSCGDYKVNSDFILDEIKFNINI